MKKAISVLLVCIMCMGLFAGCAKESPKATVTPEATEAPEATKAPEPTEVVKKEPVVIKWYMFGEQQDDLPLVMEEINKILTPKTNAILDLELIEMGAYNDKMAMIVASDEDYDLAFTSSWLNVFNVNIGKNAFMPLDDLIAEFTPKLTDAVPQWILDVAKVKGKTYAVPNQQIMYSQVCFSVQKSLAEKYNFDPTTVKEAKDLEPFLEQIKNGEKGLIPVRTGQPVVQITNEAVGEFACFKRDDTSITVEPSYTSDESKANFNQDSEWFEKGYLRSDALTVVDDAAELKANKYAVVYRTMKPGLDPELKATSGIEWISCSYAEPYVNAGDGIGTMTAMNVNSKHPEEAMKVLEAVNSDKDIYNLLVFGIKGMHYDMVDGFVQVKEDSKYKMNNSAWALGNQFNALYQVGQTEGTWEETDKINNEAQVSYLRGFTFDPEPVQTELAGLAAVKTEFEPILRYGTKDREEKWNEFVKKMNAAGSEKVVAEIQKQIDEWKIANGK